MTTFHSPWRVTVIHATFAADPAPLWKLLADFGGLPSLVPELAKSGSVTGEGVGMVRTINLQGGGSVKEVLIAFHPEQFRLSYAMENPAGTPWEHYFCTMQLQALGAEQTHLMATGYFQPHEGREAEARAALTAAYQAVFNGLARTLGKPMTMQPPTGVGGGVQGVSQISDVRGLISEVRFEPKALLFVTSVFSCSRFLPSVEETFLRAVMPARFVH